MATERLAICPRCGGNMFLEKEVDGYYEECLQCSYSREMSGITIKYKSRPSQTEKKSLTVEKYELCLGRSRSKYSRIRHEPASSRDAVNGLGIDENLEPSQDWEHPPTRILKRLRKIGAKLLYFGSEQIE